MNPAVISLSFLAGAAIFFSPCGIALLPAYISHLVSGAGTEQVPARTRARQGFLVGVVVSVGILTVFLTLGLLISLVGNIIAPYAAWVAGLTGLLLIIFGFLMFFGRAPTLHLPHHFHTERSGFVRYYVYGLAYALGGISCTLPAFLLVVFASLGSESFTGGFMNFIAFSAGTASLMIITSVLSSLSGGLVARWLKAHRQTIQRASALLIIIAGGYLIYFQFRAFDPLGFYS